MLKHYFLTEDIYDTILSDYKMYDFTKDSMYGFYHGQNIVIPKDSYIKEYKINLKNIDFAVNDLINLEKEIQLESRNGRFPASSFLNYTNFIVKKGYNNSIARYEEYVIFYYLQTFKNLTQERKFYNFNDFFDFFVEKSNNDFLVYTDFLKSKYIDVFSSGLAFQIFEEPSSINDFILDKHFSNYYNLCKRHNFNIDKYRPWIIVRRVDDKHLNQNNFKYNYIYDLDTIITFEALRKCYINYITTNIVDNIELRQVNISSYDMKRDKYFRFYVKCKLENKKIEIPDQQFDILVRFLKNNLAFSNSIRSSLYKLDSIKRKDDSIYKDWQQIFS